MKRDDLPVEQLGTYDPMPNLENQKLLSLNVERTRYWMGQGAIFSTPIAKLLGTTSFISRVLLVEYYLKRQKVTILKITFF